MQVRHLEAIMRISEAFCKMRLSEYCTSQDVDRAIAVTVDSFVGAQKVSCKKALARAFAKYVILTVFFRPATFCYGLSLLIGIGVMKLPDTPLRSRYSRDQGMIIGKVSGAEPGPRL